MPVTQYIGARYVPIIYQNPDDNSNNWKAGVPYEPLTIVSYSGGSYTSKSAVPAGASNPVDAPEYWVSIGLYSGQTSINTNNISHIQHAIANATEAGYTCTAHRDEGDFLWIDGILYQTTAEVNVNDSYTEGINITQVTDIVANIDAALSQMASDISDCSGDITTIQGNITTINGQITNLQAELADPYTILIGDSYGDGYDPNGNNDGWCQYLMDMGITGTAVHIGGAAFHLASSDPKSPEYLLSTVTTPDPDKVKRIVVALGYNDFGAAAATVKSNIASFCTYARSVYQNAQIYIGMCGYCWTRNVDSKNGYHVTETSRIYAGACMTANAIFMPQLCGCLVFNGAMSDADYKHPTETGNKIIAKAIYNALHGIGYGFYTSYTIPVTNTNLDLTGNLYLGISFVDGRITTTQQITSCSINHASAVTLNNVQFTPDHCPALPFMSMPVARQFHNYDLANGLGKYYYNAPINIHELGYADTANLAMNMINDAGNNYAASKHIDLTDAKYYSGSSAFL